jgi:hypothetical protein
VAREADVTTGKIVNHPKIGAKNRGALHLAAHAKGGHKGKRKSAGQLCPVTYTNLTRWALLSPTASRSAVRQDQGQLKGKNPTPEPTPRRNSMLAS